MKILSRMAEKTAERLGDPRDREEAQYPVPEDLVEEFGIPFRGRDGNDLAADIYRPKETSEEKLPVIVIVHGGGLFAGHPIMERGAAKMFARMGYLVFVPSYRLLTGADACGEISDICAAFDFAGEECVRRGGDPNRMFAVAESAGAFLTEYAVAMKGSEKLRRLIGYEPSRTEIKGIAFVSGMFYTTRRDLLGLVYPEEIYRERRGDREFMACMDPENEAVINNLPPSILTTSKNDFLKTYTIKYAEALKRTGIANKLVYYAEKNRKLVHAFVTIYPELPESKDAAGKIDDWFRTHS